MTCGGYPVISSLLHSQCGFHFITNSTYSQRLFLDFEVERRFRTNPMTFRRL